MGHGYILPLTPTRKPGGRLIFAISRLRGKGSVWRKGQSPEKARGTEDGKVVLRQGLGERTRRGLAQKVWWSRVSWGKLPLLMGC